MAEVFILLGGNVGDKSKIFELSRKLIGERIGFIKEMSSIYATDSWGFESALFWNQVIILATSLNPFEVLKESQVIENELGRVRKSTHYEDRTIDIDLLFYDNLQINTSELTIPHPKIADRRFVLIPLNELAPEKYHPVSGMMVKELLAVCQDQLKVDRLVD
jgi:2-amino-4-hydroxy-6-hydroxymethyldihydropteridine diphosphokinase